MIKNSLAIATGKPEYGVLDAIFDRIEDPVKFALEVKDEKILESNYTRSRKMFDISDENKKKIRIIASILGKFEQDIGDDILGNIDKIDMGESWE